MGGLPEVTGTVWSSLVTAVGLKPSGTSLVRCGLGGVERAALAIAPVPLGSGEPLFGGVRTFDVEPVEVLRSPLTAHIRYGGRDADSAASWGFVRLPGPLGGTWMAAAGPEGRRVVRLACGAAPCRSRGAPVSRTVQARDISLRLVSYRHAVRE